jgi:single-stranded DNA-binding protein
VYVEGRLSLNAWTGKDGQSRTGLSVTAWEVIPLGRIGRKRPKPASQQRPHQAEAPPFDDPLTF